MSSRHMSARQGMTSTRSTSVETAQNALPKSNEVTYSHASSAFTKKQLAELEDVFNLFNFHTHSGIMRADDLGIALRVLGLEITREQHKGYVSLFSTSATNLKEHEAALKGEQVLNINTSQQQATTQQEKIGKMANLKASMTYFTFADFVEICEDAKEARIRQHQQHQLLRKRVSSDNDDKEWLHNAFDTFDEASISAASLHKSLQKIFTSIQGHPAKGNYRAITHDEDSSNNIDKQARRLSSSDLKRKKSNHDEENEFDEFDEDHSGGLSGSLSLEVPPLDEIMGAFRDLGIDASLGMTYEDLLRVIGDSSGIL